MTEPVFAIGASRNRPNPPEGRFEYRVWPRRKHPAISRLQQAWPLVAAERRSDIYLLPAERSSALVKLRNGKQLEIKRHTLDAGAIQHWTMPHSTGFPLSAAHRRDAARALALGRELPGDAGRSPAHFIAAVSAQDSDPVSQIVRKSRLLFRKDDCRAEICRVAVGTWTGLTIALEAAELPSIARAVDDLQLGALANRSYGDRLRPLCGMRAPSSRLLFHAETHERR